MKQETTDLLMVVLDALVAHTMYCRPRVAALEQVLREHYPADYQRYENILDGLRSNSDYRESEQIYAKLRKALLQDHEREQ
jgi:hypothetical protein